MKSTIDLSNLYAVMGDPIAHSLSPVIHQQFAEQVGHSIEYLRLQVGLADLRSAIAIFKGHGLNITAPLKEAVFRLIPQRSARANAVQAVNTLIRLASGEWLGDNTDGIGFMRDLSQHYQQPLTDKRVLILGAGGAVRGILPILLAQRPKQITLVNRDLAKARSLVNDILNASDFIKVCAWDTLSAMPYDLIIHSTTAPRWQDDLPSGLCQANTLCYDLRYDAASPFIGWAKAQGVKYISGLGMLVEQAAEAFFLWRGIRPSTHHINFPHLTAK